MVNLQLYINGAEADLNGVVSMPLTKTFDEMSDPVAIVNDRSKTVTLPGTPKNNKLFGHIWRLDALNQNFNPLQRTPFVLTDSGSIIFSGYMKLNAVKRNGSWVTGYDCTLFGGLGGLLYELNEMELANTTMPYNNFEHTVNAANVAPNAIPVGGNSLVYFMSNQGKYEDFESNTRATGTSTGDPNADYQELDKEYDENQLLEYRSYYQRPAVLLSYIIARIMENRRWSFSNDFRNSPYFNATRLCFKPPYKDVMGAKKESGSILYSAPSGHSSQFSQITSFDQCNHQEIATFWDSVNSSTKYINGGRIDVSDIAARGGTIEYDLQFQLSARLYSMAASNDAVWALGVSSRWQAGLFGDVVFVDNDTNAVIHFHNVYDVFQSRYMIQKWGNNTDIGGVAYGPNDVISVVGKFNIPQETTQVRVYFSLTVQDAGVDTDLNGLLMWRSNQWVSIPGTGASARVDIQAPLFINISKASFIATIDQQSIRSGDSVGWPDICPKGITQLAFLKNITKIFGLLWKFNDKLPPSDNHSTQVEWLTRNDFFANYKIHDWTHKIDTSKSMDIAPILLKSRYSTFKWGESKSARATEYALSSGQDYGSLKVDTGYMFDSEDQPLIPENIFTNGVISREYDPLFNDRDNNTPGRDDKDIPAIFEKKDNSQEFLDEDMQLFFDAGTQGCSPYRITDDTDRMILDQRYCWSETDNGTTYFVYRKMARVLDPNPADPNNKPWSLDFGKPSQAYYPSTDTDYPDGITIYDRCWKKFLQERFSYSTRVMTCYVWMSNSEFAQWEFSDFVKIENTLWHVNKIIDFDPTKNASTKVELVRVENLEAYTNGQNWQ